MHFVRAEALRAGAVVEAGAEARAVRQQAGMRNHDSIIDAKPIFWFFFLLADGFVFYPNTKRKGKKTQTCRQRL